MTVWVTMVDFPSQKMGDINDGSRSRMVVHTITNRGYTNDYNFNFIFCLCCSTMVKIMGERVKIDHIALQTDNPKEAAEWYRDNFEAKILYADATWSFVQFENVKLAFVVPSQHPVHIAFEKRDLKSGKIHRDGSRSIYARDPFGNFYELIRYKQPDD